MVTCALCIYVHQVKPHVQPQSAGATVGMVKESVTVAPNSPSKQSKKIEQNLKKDTKKKNLSGDTNQMKLDKSSKAPVKADSSEWVLLIHRY